MIKLWNAIYINVILIKQKSKTKIIRQAQQIMKGKKEEGSDVSFEYKQQIGQKKSNYTQKLDRNRKIQEKSNVHP